jgi:hypothetical protein
MAVIVHIVDSAVDIALRPRISRMQTHKYGGRLPVIMSLLRQAHAKLRKVIVD